MGEAVCEEVQIRVVFVLEGRAVYVCGVYVGGREDMGWGCLGVLVEECVREGLWGWGVENQVFFLCVDVVTAIFDHLYPTISHIPLN